MSTPESNGRAIALQAGSDRVSGLRAGPPDADRLLVLAHGAGAGMRHPFMESMAAGLAERGLGTLRFQFPYMERGRRRPDPPARLESTIVTAVQAGRRCAEHAHLFAGGKSMGGRMASQAPAARKLPDVRGLIFLGFPLHPAGRPGTDRAAHLADVDVPMLFLQGTRDRLADLDLLRPVLDELGDRATLEVIEAADHSFAVPKRSGIGAEEVLGRLVDTIDRWTRERVAGDR